MPRKDPTPIDEIDEAMAENIRLGYVVESSPGRYSLTPAGRKHVEEQLLPRIREEGQ